MKTLQTSALFGVLVAAASAQTLSTPQDGFRASAVVRIDEACAGSLVTDSFSDGTYVAYDGRTVERRSASGVLLGRYAAFTQFGYPSFVRISADEQTIVFGESSTHGVWRVDTTGGAPVFLAALTFNYDAAFDADGQSLYVSASTGAFGTNSVHRIDLASGTTEHLVDVVGYSGPLAVDSDGDLHLAHLSDQFPIPADSVVILEFTDTQLDGGTVLTEADATVFASGYDGMSSLRYDLVGDRFALIETNTTPSGFGSLVHLVGGDGTAVATVAESSTYAGGLELVNPGLGGEFGPYQPNSAALRLSISDCFGTGAFERTDVIGARPRMAWNGPSLGNTGSASFTLNGAPANGYAALWAARSIHFQANVVTTDLGGEFPLVLRSDASNFVRRFPLQNVDASGFAEFDYWQESAIEGAFFGQWIVFDANMTPLTTTEAAVNASPF